MFAHNKKRKIEEVFANGEDNSEENLQKRRKLEGASRPIINNEGPSNTKKLVDHFRQGDLVFGLTKHHRHTLITQLKEHGYQHTYANQLNMPAVQFLLDGADETQLNTLTAAQKKHYLFLKEHSSYLFAPGGKPLPSEDNKELGGAIIRACKLLASSANENCRVHFELDGINIQRAYEGGLANCGVSNSELKAIYRKAKDKENQHLFFYQKGEPTAAPWKNPENAEYFQAYDTYRNNKQKNSPT